MTEARPASRTPVRDGLAAAAALCLLLLMAILLRLLPAGRLLRLCGSVAPLDQPLPPCIPLNEGRARTIKLALRRAVPLSPLRADCLPQALAAAAFCRLWRHVPATTYLGAALDGEKPLEAHAWVRMGAVTICGADQMARFTPVARFQLS
jgi:hypothetical protein